MGGETERHHLTGPRAVLNRIPRIPYVAFDAPLTVAHRIYHANGRPPLLPSEMEKKSHRFLGKMRDSKVAQTVAHGMDEALWLPSRVHLKLANAVPLMGKHVSPTAHAFSQAVEDVLSVKPGKNNKVNGSGLQIPGVRFGINTARFFGLFPIPIPLKIADLPTPFPIPAFNFHVVLPILGDHTIINNPAGALPVLITLNAVAAAVGFGVPNVVRAVKEKKPVRAGMYAGMHFFDVMYPLGVTNSFLWDVNFRYRDTARRFGRLEILREGLLSERSSQGRKQRFADVVRQRIQQAADKHHLTYGQYVQRFNDEQHILQTVLDEKIAAYEALRHEEKKGVELESARQDAIRHAQKVVLYPKLADIINASGK